MTGREWTALPHERSDHDDRCESEFITGPMVWSPCGCAVRAAGRETPRSTGGDMSGSGHVGCWVVDFDYREDNGPTLVGPFNTKGGAEAWLAKQSGYEASVVPVAWHNQWLPVQP